jgi:SH3-like domain-containing protein
LRVIDQQGEWSLIEDHKKRKGWVASRLLIKNTTVLLKYNKGNLRKGPSHQDDIVANIDYVTLLQVIEKQQDWLKAYKKDGTVGWIHKDMVWP